MAKHTHFQDPVTVKPGITRIKFGRFEVNFSETIDTSTQSGKLAFNLYTCSMQAAIKTVNKSVTGHTVQIQNGPSGWLATDSDGWFRITKLAEENWTLKYQRYRKSPNTWMITPQNNPEFRLRYREKTPDGEVFLVENSKPECDADLFIVDSTTQYIIPYKKRDEIACGYKEVDFDAGRHNSLPTKKRIFVDGKVPKLKVSYLSKSAASLLHLADCTPYLVDYGYEETFDEEYEECIESTVKETADDSDN